MIINGYLLKRLLTAFLGAVVATLPASPIQQVEPMPRGRGFHGAAVVGNYLYMIGGRTSDATNPAIEVDALLTWVGLIQPDGSIGAWGTATPIPGPRHYIGNSTVVLGNMIYVLGGSDAVAGGNSLDTVIFNRVKADGSLGRWRSAPTFGEGLATPTAVATPGHLHLIGGLDTSKGVSRSVWTNQLQADGSLARWERSAPLPVGLWYHQAGVAAGRVFVWGGLEKPNEPEPNPTQSIYSAPILATGKIGDWNREEVTLPVAYYGASTSVAGPYLISFSPRYKGSIPSNDAWWTAVGPRGMQPWQRQPTEILNKVYHASAPDYGRGSIYMMGGRGPTKQDDLLREISLVSLVASATQAAEQNWANERPGTTATVSVSETEQNRFGAVVETAPGFQKIGIAQIRAGSERLPLVMYFTAPETEPGKDQMRQLTPDLLRRLSRQVALGQVDVTQDRQTPQNRGVFRVPSWIFFDRNGKEVNRVAGLMSATDLETEIAKLN